MPPSHRFTEVVKMSKTLVPLLAATALLIAACAPAAPTTASPTGQATAKQGGTARITFFQEPDNLNPLYGGGLRVTNTVLQAVFNGLWVADEKGDFQPELAAEVPTVQNGGVSADGKTITVKLKRDVKWADGKPFTADDVKFTYDVVMSPKTTLSKSTLRNIATFAVKDPYTIEWKMAEVFPAYLTLFSYPSGIIPKHHLEAVPLEDLGKHEFSRKPFGTGAFRVTEWQAASHISLEANPNYWKGKPKLEKVIFRITPDKNTAIAQLRANETDVVLDLAESDAPEIEKVAGWRILSVAGLTSDRLFLNLGESGVPDGSKPHPVLSDKKVRQALELGINKQELVDVVLFGKTKVASSEYPVGWAAPNIAPSKYDQDAAKGLLEEAGWRPGADGIREKAGRKLSVTVSGVTGNKLRDDVAALIQAGWKKIGVDMQIKNVAAATLVGEWAANGIVQRGNFDIAFYGTSPSIDPRSVSVRFHSDQIPRDEPGKQGGSNNMRYKNPEVDRLSDEADRTLDQEKRKTNYIKVMNIAAEDLPIIYLYYRANIEAQSDRLVGLKSHATRWITWNIHEWGMK
jgi:peptide/nickel transport system substrate-binding protein